MNFKLHIKTPMFLHNPYVVRVVHTDSTPDNIKLVEFMQYRKKAKQEITSTWGYSDPTFEIIKSDNAETLTLFGHTVTYNSPIQRCHSYWVFTDEADALQFRLTAGESIKMHMWPKKILFTIYEYDKN
jgi:hypothetical protein